MVTGRDAGIWVAGDRKRACGSAAREIPVFRTWKVRPLSSACLGKAAQAYRRALLAEQQGLQDDAVGGYPLKAEIGEQNPSVGEGEQVEGCLVVERGTGVAVDVREHLVDVGLRQSVEGRAPGQDEAEELVVTLDAALLPGGTTLLGKM